MTVEHDAVQPNTLTSSESERSRLQSLLDQGAGSSSTANTQIGQLTNQLNEEQQVSAVYPAARRASRKVTAFVDFLGNVFQRNPARIGKAETRTPHV